MVGVCRPCGAPLPPLTCAFCWPHGVPEGRYRPSAPSFTGFPRMPGWCPQGGGVENRVDDGAKKVPVRYKI